jgi:hypothetical protein
MRFLAIIAAGLGIVGGAAACATGHSGGSGGEEAYPDVQSFCQAWGQAECSNAVVSACGAKSASSCVSARAASCIAGQPQGTTYVAANAPACIDLARMAYSTSTLSSSQLAQMSVVCGTQVFSGPGAVRSPCTTAADCSSLDNLTCVIPYGQMDGKCLTPTMVPPNESCADESAVCGDGWFCDPMMKLCTVDGASGESCQDGWRPCADGLTCPNGLFATCTQKFDDGHPCTLDGDCTGGLCDKASTMGEGTCASEITLTPLDQACAQFTGQ